MPPIYQKRHISTYSPLGQTKTIPLEPLYFWSFGGRTVKLFLVCIFCDAPSYLTSTGPRWRGRRRHSHTDSRRAGGHLSPARPPGGRPAQVGTPRVGTPRVGTPRVGTPRVGTPRVGTPRVGTPQVGAPQVGTPQVGKPRVGRSQVGTPQVGTPRVGTQTGR